MSESPLARILRGTREHPLAGLFIWSTIALILFGGVNLATGLWWLLFDVGTTNPDRVMLVLAACLLFLGCPALIVTLLGALANLAATRQCSRRLCEHCGYDLRASSGRCPECGRRFEQREEGETDDPRRQLP